MRLQGHPNIIEFIAFFETPTDYKMVFEKVDGGELLTHISDRKYFTEREASQVTHDVASALSFVHGKGTVLSHRRYFWFVCDVPPTAAIADGCMVEMQVLRGRADV